MAATDFKDYYGTLGVGKTATADEIKQAYRKLARKFHPDVNPGDKSAEAKFKEVNEAYEVLSDTDKRSKYDQFGQYWKQAGSGAGWPPNGGNVDFNSVDFGKYGSFDEFINELLGRFGGPTPGGGSARQQRSYTYRPGAGSPGAGFGGYNDFSGYGGDPTAAGQDLESPLSLTLSEAFHGVQKRLNLNSEMITVRIPAGAKPGSRVRVKGKGQINPYNQQRGDLYLIVEVAPHSFFQFDGDNLVCEVAIAPDEAVLGASIEVPTCEGTVTMNIPAGIRSGQTLRLRGKGWPKPKDGRGDQMVKVVITPPPEISPVERELYEKIRHSRTFDPRSHLKQVTL
ncbi:MAG: DnaJ domain-containing protein [Oculatellaceae cyanobacterium Prado106]|jgi:curved DNA-binding protein|nr:DnaJ domain-containing protein [Oculatellaceae cyanobacterium Prado106]